MSTLATRFREEVAKSKDPRMKNEMESDVAYPTGYLAFDFLNGSMIHVESKDDEKLNFRYFSVGITDGSMIMLIGRSGCGKTTLMLQMSSNIIRRYKSSCLYFDSVEGGVKEDRALKLMHFTRDEYKAKVIPRNQGVTIENVYERLKIIFDLKINNREDYMYDTGLYDSFGERIYKYEPTIYALDSIALLVPDGLTKEEKLSGQMSTTSSAKMIAQIFRRMTPMLKTVNIIFFSINHIMDEVSFTPKKPDLAFLKVGERLPGGKTPTYTQSTILRLDDKSKLTEDKEFGVYGSVVEVTLAKSRSNGNGHTCRLVFDENVGFDQYLSLFVLLKENNLVQGGGRSYHIKDSEIKFSQKEFKNKLIENEELQKQFMKTVYDLLTSQLIERDTKAYEDSHLDLVSNIINQISEAKIA